MKSKASRPGRTLGVDWIWPHWLERQLDPQAAAYVTPPTTATPHNVTLRDWTVIGTVASSHRAMVDPRGLLTPRRGGWSLDWWILGEDRWHFPSRDTAVRQQLVDDTPVVETTMRIRGGDAVHRAYALPSPQPMAVVEITNRTTTPIAAVLSVRPYNPEGLATVGGVTLREQAVRVDDQLALLLPKRPQGAIASTFERGDVAHRVIAEDTAGDLPDAMRCPAGLATAAFVFPLAHTATLRVGIPLEGDAVVRARRRPARDGTRTPDVPLASDVPTSDDVVRSWQAQTSSRGLRLAVPEGRLASAIEANRRFLLAMHEGDESDASTFSFGDASDQLGALDLFGFSAEVADSIRGFPARLRVDGRFLDDTRDADATAAALQAMAAHWRLTSSLEGIDADAVARSARWIERRRTTGDGFCSLRGLVDAAALLTALGEDRLAAECRVWADRRRERLLSSMGRATERLMTPAVPTTPSGRIDGEVVDALAAHAPLGLVPADDPHIATIADAVRERSCVGAAVFRSHGDRSGLVPMLTARLAEVELATGDARCLDRLAWLVEAASATFTWPEVIHPSTGGGSGGDGHHGPTAAAFLRLVRHLLVREVDDRTLAVCSMLPESWRGQNLEVHDAPTRLGMFSFAVRWHDDRPALLWDLKRRAVDGRLQITAPGLDASWSTAEAKGEALLAPAPGLRPTANEGSFT